MYILWNTSTSENIKAVKWWYLCLRLWNETLFPNQQWLAGILRNLWNMEYSAWRFLHLLVVINPMYKHYSPLWKRVIDCGKIWRVIGYCHRIQHPPKQSLNRLGSYSRSRPSLIFKVGYGGVISINRCNGFACEWHWFKGAWWVRGWGWMIYGMQLIL